MAQGSVRRLPSGRWQVRWYTRDGRHPGKTFTVKRDAERFLQRAIVDSERDGMDIIVRGQTLQGIIDMWWPSTERSVKSRTAERYREHKRTIQRHPIASMPLRDLDYDAVQGFVNDLSRIYAPATVSAIYGVLNLILADGARRKKIHMIAKPRMPRQSRRQLVIPTRDEVERLAAAVDARMCAAVILAGYCGLRMGELLALTRADVNLADGWVFVHASRNQSTGAIEGTKTDAARRVYLPGRARDVLGEHLDEYPGVDGSLFPVTASVFDKSWRLARKLTGLEGVRFHDLRHAAASNMIAAGWNVKLVSKQLGHANATQTLNVYTHLWPDSFAPAIRQLDEYLDHG